MRRTSLIPWIFGALAAATLILLVLLSQQNRQLRQTIQDLQYRTSRPEAGQFVPTFSAATLDGDSVRVVSGEPEDRQVLILFNTTCPHCLASVSGWNALHDRLATEGTQLIGISLDSLEKTRAYRKQHGLRYPVTHFPTQGLMRMYRGGWVPATLVLDGEGRVLYSRMGALTEAIAVDSVVAAVRWQPESSTREMPEVAREDPFGVSPG